MQTPSIVHKGMGGVLDVFGPTVEFLTPPSEAEAVCGWLPTTTIGSAARQTTPQSALSCHDESLQHRQRAWLRVEDPLPGG
jgi:hypothetical protein